MKLTTWFSDVNDLVHWALDFTIGTVFYDLVFNGLPQTLGGTIV